MLWKTSVEEDIATIAGTLLYTNGMKRILEKAKNACNNKEGGKGGNYDIKWKIEVITGCHINKDFSGFERVITDDEREKEYRFKEKSFFNARSGGKMGVKYRNSIYGGGEIEFD